MDDARRDGVHHGGGASLVLSLADYVDQLGGGDARESLRIGVLPRVGGLNPVDVGEYQQLPCPRTLGEHRADGIGRMARMGTSHHHDRIFG